MGAGVELPATLTLPPGPGRHPAIVCLHPATDRSRDQLLFRHLAELLPPRGIAVLRYDRRGDDVPFDNQVADARSAIGALRQRQDIDAGRIGLWGFSQGGWIAPMVAADDQAVAFLVLVASTGVTPAEQMRWGSAKHAREAGFAEDAVRRIDELRQVFEEFERGHVDRRAAQRAVDAEADEPWFEHAWVRREIPERPGFWPDMDFDPFPIFARVRVPTLLFYGEDDEWQPIDASIDTWRRAATVAGNDDLTIVRLAGTRHAPTLRGDADPSVVAPEYERRLLAWLAKHATPER